MTLIFSEKVVKSLTQLKLFTTQKDSVSYAIKAVEGWDKLDQIITAKLDDAVDWGECSALRWVLEKMSEVGP